MGARGRHRGSPAVSALLGLVAALTATGHAADGPPAHSELSGTAAAGGFRFADVFPETATVEVRLPATATRPSRVDVYVVKARDAHGWRADPLLEEARRTCPAVDTPAVRCPGGAPPCRCELAGGDEAALIPLAGPGALSAAAPPCFDEGCLALGAAYDVVVDRDLDGRLSAADRIDGAGDRDGLYVTRNPEAEILDTVCADFAVDGPPAFFDRQRLYWPARPRRLGRVPLVVISHGGGHDYAWYGYLQRHLASWGYAALAHQNQTRCAENPYPGCTDVGAASETMLRHTDALLDLLLDEGCSDRIAPVPCGQGASPADPCELAGILDRERIVWIGHSRGGTGAVWARTRLDEGDFVPEHYGLDALKLLSTMAPPDLPADDERLGEPGDTPFHLIYGAADNDVAGRPGLGEGQSFQVFERARGPRHSDYLHGVGHGWFHDHCAPGGDTGCDFAAEPRDLLIGVERTHRIVRALYVPLLAHYLRGEAAAGEFLWRPWATLRPPGDDLDPALDPRLRVIRDFRPAGERVAVLDDHQRNPLPERSSAGTAVRHDLDPSTVHEGPMEDDDCTFDWNRPPSPGPCGCYGDGGLCQLNCNHIAMQPMNGMTRSRDGVSRGVVLDWPGPDGAGPWSYRVEWPDGVPAGPSAELSVRLAQMPRHPNTAWLDGDLDLHLVLVDRDGRSSRVSLSTLASRLPTPYPRPDGRGVNACTFGGQCGIALCCPVGCNPFLSDIGWQVAFDVVRLRLADFAAAGRVDVHRPAEVGLELGAAGASPRGRIALDDLLVVGDGR